MKTKSRHLIFEERFTFKIPVDLDECIRTLKFDAENRGYDLELNLAEMTGSYVMTLSSGNSRMKDFAFGHISQSEEATIVEGIVGIDGDIVVTYLISMIPYFFFIIATAGRSHQFSILLVTIAVFMTMTGLVAIKFRKKGLLDLISGCGDTLVDK